MNRRIFHQAACLQLAAVLTVVPTAARAINFTWDGSRPSTDWDAEQLFAPFDNNWDLILVGFPNADDTVTFPDTAADFVVTLNGNRTVQSATFSGVSGYTLSESTLTLSTGDLTANGAATHTINSNVTLGNVGDWDVDANVVLNGNLTAGFDLDLTGTGSVTHTGAASSVGAVTIGATNTLNLDGGSITAAGGLDNTAGGTLNFNDGTLNITGGAFLPSASTVNYEIEGATGSDLAHLTLGAGATFSVSSDLIVSEFQDGAMTLTDGAVVTSTFGGIGLSSTDTGTVTVSGTDPNGLPSAWNMTGELDVAGDNSTLLIDGGGQVTAGSLDIAGSTQTTGAVTVSGTDAGGNPSALVLSGNLELARGFPTFATLDILAGAHVSNHNAVLGDNGDDSSDAIVTVSGADPNSNPATWANSGDLTVGTDEHDFNGAEVRIQSGGLVTVAGTTTVLSSGRIFLTGGRFEFGRTTLAEYTAFNANSGELAGAVEITGTNDIDDLPGLVAFGGVDTSGVSFLNSGLVFGYGTLAADFTNLAAGEVQVIGGRQIQFQGAATSNEGQLTLAGGELEFTQGLTNESAGLVLGNGSLRAAAGISNDGTMAFTATAAVIGDVTNNASGLITSSGGTTTFMDDVANNGEIRTNANSFTVHQGSYSGNGDTGTGTVIIEGNLKPGSSPGIMNFGGDLSFDAAGQLEVEIVSAAGTPGVDHDQVNVTGAATLNGTLQVDFLADPNDPNSTFFPTPGETFQIMNFASASGTFPTLSGGVGLLDPQHGTGTCL